MKQYQTLIGLALVAAAIVAAAFIIRNENGRFQGIQYGPNSLAALIIDTQTGHMEIGRLGGE